MDAWRKASCHELAANLTTWLCPLGPAGGLSTWGPTTENLVVLRYPEVPVQLVVIVLVIILVLIFLGVIVV
jgi:hypothetical protein